MLKKAKNLFKRRKPDPSAADASPAQPTDQGAEPAGDDAKQKTFFTQLKDGLKKTRHQLTDRLSAMTGGRALDESVLEDLEELLIGADLGVKTTMELVERIRKRAKKEHIAQSDDLGQMVHDELKSLMESVPALAWSFDHKPTVILVTGVNGVGKTTTIGKLAYQWHNSGKRVMLCAADTFRAAASEQLEIWAQRAGVPIVTKADAKDPATVVFDALKQARESSMDILLVDTAGRLHNNPNLMNELAKIHRIAGREVPGAPHHVLLILDAVTGQNGLAQAKEFVNKVSVTDLIVTKLDGTAKGGVSVAISNELGLPIRYIGVGEKMDDLLPFDAASFADAMLDKA